jgi:hypothetical protein
MGAITIESTAEGQEGRFFEMAQTARSTPPRSRKDWKFHFSPWWGEEAYRLPPSFEVITTEDAEYFDSLDREHGIKLTPDQKAWYITTLREQGGDMKREYPSTPDEAFEQAIEGAYFSTQLAHADRHGLIGRFPYDPRYPVNTFWDLGRNDLLTIWLHQRVGQRNRFIGYYENSGEHVSFYAKWLDEWKRQYEAQWGDHFWPHDGDRQDLFLENGRLAEAERHGLRPRIVARPQAKMDAIDAARAAFASCDFDEATCSVGIRRLRHYRKDWDEQRGVWRDRPYHDENSHGADSFMTFACGYRAPTIAKPAPPRRRATRGMV